MSKDKTTDSYSDQQLADLFGFEPVFEYPVVFEISQTKPSKTITTGHGGTTIATAPGWTLTVLADQDSDGTFTEILTTNISGVTKTTPLGDGITLYEFNGPALNIDPGPVPAGVYYLISGHHTWVGDADFNTVEPLSGRGPMTVLNGDYLLA